MPVDGNDVRIEVKHAEHEYGLKCLPEAPQQGLCDAAVLAVGHRQLVDPGEAGINAFGQPCAVVYEMKSLLPLGGRGRSPAKRI